MIEIIAVDNAGDRLEVEAQGTMKAASAKAREVFGMLGPRSFVEVVLNGCAKRLYGSLLTRRDYRGYVPSSGALNAKA